MLQDKQCKLAHDDDVNKDYVQLCKRVARLGEALNLSAPQHVLDVHLDLVRESLEALSPQEFLTHNTYMSV